MNNEAIIISVILIIMLAVSAAFVVYINTHRKRDTEYIGWTVGIALFDVFMLILGIAAIIGYLQK